MSTSRRKPPTPKEMQRTVDTFNANLPVGSVVEYRSDPGASPLTTVVRGEAFILSGHTPCAFVEGVAGCVAFFALRAPARSTEGVGVSDIFPRTLALAIGYFIAEVLLDALAVGILYSQHHPWWALAWCILAGFSANLNVKRYAGGEARRAS